jgi:parallel beta-helix repeat protein
VAKNGDTILVGEGTYNENPLIKTNGISIIGKNKEKTIIEGGKTSSGIRIDGVNNVIISGFTIKNSIGGGGPEAAGVTIYKGNDNTVSNMNILSNSVGISIYQGSNNNVISGNYIESSTRYGIYIYASNDNKIFNNNVKNNKIGIYAYASKTNRIYSNNLIDNKDQAYDNGGNSWDYDNTGNYWSDNKGSGEYVIILPEKKSTDKFPLKSPITIKVESVATQPGQKESEGAKSTPGFTVYASFISLIVIGIFRMRGK